MPFQYGNEANPRAHYEGTGAEIADALPQVDALVAGLGTGGTLMGAGDRLRESFPDLVVAAAEPLQGDLVYGLRSLADGYVPPILDISKLDRKLLVTNEESVEGLRPAARARGDLRGRLVGRRRPRRTAPRRGDGGGRRRRRPRRRRLEVPLRRLLDASRPTRWARPWKTASGGDPGRGALGARRARRGGAPERGLRADRAPRRRRRALLPGQEPRREPVPLRARDRPRGVVPRGRGLRAGRLPLASRRARPARRAPTSSRSGSGRRGPT